VAHHITVSEAARAWDIPPRTISDLFYARRLDDRRCPIVGGRRLIPHDYLPVIAEALRNAGYPVAAGGTYAVHPAESASAGGSAHA
jgi:hypothetical protein